MVKVSVIIPVYNTEIWLKECLDSLLIQTLAECEFICVDDGSTDESYKIIEKYVNDDKRFSVIRQKHMGLIEARNNGIGAAKGKYISFLDSDDYLQNQNALEELYMIAEESDLDFVTFDAECFYETDVLKETSDRGNYYVRTKEYGHYSSGRKLFCDMMENDDFCIGACIIFSKREWVIKNNLWFMEGIYPEDCLWCFMSYMKAGNVRHIQRGYYKYRIRSNSLTTEKVYFSVIYGRLCTFKEILTYMLTNLLSEKEEKAVCKLIDSIVWHMKNKFLQLEPQDACFVNMLSPANTLLIRYMNQSIPDYFKFNISLYLKGFKYTLQSASGVIIYGAGVVGKLLYNYMRQEQILNLFETFAVSDVDQRKKFLMGHDVKCIQDKILNRSHLVVIAVTQKYQKEMSETAQNLGFDRILLIDDYLFHILEEHYG